MWWTSYSGHHDVLSHILHLRISFLPLNVFRLSFKKELITLIIPGMSYRMLPMERS